jgi:hypothetical protein
MNAAAAALALVARREHQIVAAFREKRATSGPTARKLRELGLNDSRVFRALVTAAVIRKAGPERYFLSEAAWTTRPQPKIPVRTVVIVALMLAIIIGVVFLVRR